MTSRQITLIDIPTRDPRRCWSPNSWKARILLNFKGLDYKTDWTPYPDLKPRLKDHVPPNKHGAEYTSPTIFLPDGTGVMDSRVIASVLEERHPSPSVHLDAPQLARLEALLPAAATPLRPLFLAHVPRTFLNDASLEYWYRTRGEALGRHVDEHERANPAEGCWAAARPELEKITALLRETEGPFFLGDTVSYADLVWGAYLVFWKTLGEERFQALLKATGDADAHLQLFKGVEKWTVRNDH